MGMKGNKDRNVEKNIEKDKSRGGKEANKQQKSEDRSEPKVPREKLEGSKASKAKRRQSFQESA